jgi:glyoxylase-like metal-dependent hydrolase (beta-lactamase superfamily II)
MKLQPLLPALNIPSSCNTVSVSIIDTTVSVSGILGTSFFSPEIEGNKYLAAPSWSFLVQHPTLNRSLVFDLGVRSDWENLPPPVVELVNSGVAGELHVEKGVRKILEDGGFNASSLEAVIWSHWHFDHTGDPSSFDNHTALVVGPGFKQKVLPGYPANPNATFLESDYAGRELRELSFQQNSTGYLTIGNFQAFDYFNDGSYYLLSMPGHAVGHLGGLARVSHNPDSFIFMGGDSCHHAGELRPSEYRPLPKNISPNPFTSISAPKAPCPGAQFEKILRNGDRTKPFYGVSEVGVHYNTTEVAETIAKVRLVLLLSFLIVD